jgi:hypothetical protein
MVARTGQLLGAGLTAAMGWIHLRLWLDGYQEIPVIGPLFLLNVIGAALLAVGLLAAPARLRGVTAAVAAGFTATTLAALLISLTVGLFGLHESLHTPLVAPTLIVESAGVVVLTLTALLHVGLNRVRKAGGVRKAGDARKPGARRR